MLNDNWKIGESMDILQIIRTVVDGGIIVTAIFIISRIISSTVNYVLTYKLAKQKLSNDYEIQNKKHSNHELALKLCNLNNKFKNLHIEDNIIKINQQKDSNTEKPKRYNKNQESKLTVTYRKNSDS